MARRLAIVLLLSLPACIPAAHRKDTTVCPEYRDLRCLTGEACTMDASRGCRVCRCEDPDAPASANADERALPPEP